MKHFSTFLYHVTSSVPSLFNCTLESLFSPGLCLQVRFEYVAEQLDAVESFWSFVIETLSLSIPFLCVGSAREPLVYLDRPHLDFGELLVGVYIQMDTQVQHVHPCLKAQLRANCCVCVYVWVQVVKWSRHLIW